MTRKVLGIEGLGSEITTFDLVGDELVNAASNITRPVPGSDSFVDARLTADDTYIVVQMQTSNELHAALWADGADVTWGSGLALTVDAPAIAPHPTDPTLFACLDSADANACALYRIDESDLSISKIATTSTITLASIEGVGIGWNADGTRVAFGNRTNVYLYSWDGTTLTSLDDLAVFTGTSERVQPCFVPGQERIVCGNGNGTQLELVSYAGDTLTTLDSTTTTSTAFCRCAVSPDGNWFAQGGRPTIGTSRVWPISDGTFGTPVDFPDEWAEAVWLSNDRIATINDPNLSFMPVRIYSWDGTTITELFEESSSVANAQRARLVVESGTTPPTDQQTFEARFADVAGRDPLPTALQQRTPAKQLVNYLVSMYRYNPRIVIYDAQVELGELALTTPAPEAGDVARMIWIEDPRAPEFTMGRWAQVLGRSGGALPGTVTLILRIDDNPDAFIKEPA